MGVPLCTYYRLLFILVCECHIQMRQIVSFLSFPNEFNAFLLQLVSFLQLGNLNRDAVSTVKLISSSRCYTSHYCPSKVILLSSVGREIFPILHQSEGKRLEGKGYSKQLSSLRSQLTSALCFTTVLELSVITQTVEIRTTGMCAKVSFYTSQESRYCLFWLQNLEPWFNSVTNRGVLVICALMCHLTVESCREIQIEVLCEYH